MISNVPRDVRAVDGLDLGSSVVVSFGSLQCPRPLRADNSGMPVVPPENCT